jgi:signal recognition particle receptor subunit beta
MVSIPMLIELTHMDFLSAWEPKDIASALGVENSTDTQPSIVVNTTKKPSVTKALQVFIPEITKTSRL